MGDTTVAGDTLEFESADDIALADRMNAGREQILAELHKLIVGQDEVIELVLLTLFVGGNSLIVGVPGPGQDAADPDARARCSTSSSTASSSRPT